MSIGNFNEASDSNNEVNETKEAADNTEKPRNQILEVPGSYDDDFDKKLDSNEDNTDENNIREYGNEGRGEKQGFLEKMKNLFSHKENNAEKNIENEDKTDKPESSESDADDTRKNFKDNLQEDAPSVEEQANRVKDLPGRDEYLENRDKSEQQKQEHPDLKGWEISSEQLDDIRQGQQEIGAKYNPENKEKVEIKEGAENNDTEDRTPGGDAWDRRFGKIEN